MTFYARLQSETEAERTYLRAAPIIGAVFEGWVTPESYLAFLTQAYHHVKHTEPLLMACGSRLPARLEWLREALGEYIEEEMGHQEWILKDIAMIGGDAEAVRHGTPAMATELMTAYAYHVIDRGNPVGFFGMVNVLEGTSIELATPAAEIIRKQLGLPRDAFTYLDTHGTLDQDHIKFFEKLMNRLEDPDDQAAVVHTARIIYRLYGDMFRGLPMPEAAVAS
ncbi:iron-containing redox enzyme family protein [Spectribacter hydrogenoxidans]|uniref:Iron-containing redox enzyme family protein n=1 Tax=Spectribacter hydrogenoxidans TaxID=3075608 RepID=A0ABU3C2V5_9GAMM|nr:iron-containing redox enzyme family protein [Salinisphaera sp. W335]MDT0635877.1 iron-containing redox enzyme family protein [Salinisphaera sp. W335]